MRIEYIDTSYCKTDRPDLLRIKQFSFPKSYWKQEGYRKQEIKYDSYLVDRKGYFLTGLLECIVNYCNMNDIEVTMIGGDIHSEFKPGDITPLIQLRDDQKRLVYNALSSPRGVIKSPTGSGKTVMAAAIMSAYPENRILFLCHTISLLKQTKEELDKFQVGPSSIVYGMEKDFSARIIISTVQSFCKDEVLEEMQNEFDLVIVDEAHHCNSLSVTKKLVNGVKIEKKTGYFKVLTSIIAPIRYGITATLQDSKEGRFALEGLIGPVVSEISLKEGVEQGLLAKPKVKLIPIPEMENLREYRTYPDIYQAAIVEYRKRNRIIIDETKKLNEEGKSVLIYINKIEHGERLQEIADRIGLPAIFVRGETTAEEREFIRKLMDDKKCLTVIATTVWKEGINIRSLDCVMIAGGGKKELTVLQEVGRALRKTEHKHEVLLIDFLDQGKYISEHSISRISVYVQEEWI